MTTEKKLYRARKSIGGGVCTGIADYFEVDSLIVQIITVLLTLATGGLLAIAYIALWIILPQEPDPDAPFEVTAESVHSDTYGPVDYYQKKQEEAATKRSSMPESNYSVYPGSAHIPPEPPRQTYEWSTQQADGASGSPATVYSSAVGAFHQETTQGATFPNTVPTSKKMQSDESNSTAARLGLWLGLGLLFIGASVLFNNMISGVKWWQFWPLLFVIMGLGLMVVPGRKGRRKRNFASGFLQFIFGIATLSFSLGFLSWSSLEPIFMNLWPVLLIMCGFFVIGAVLDTPLFTILGCLCFVLFCVVGIVWFSTPGPTEIITLTLPSGKAYSFSMSSLW